MSHAYNARKKALRRRRFEDPEARRIHRAIRFGDLPRYRLEWMRAWRWKRGQFIPIHRAKRVLRSLYAELVGYRKQDG